MLLVHVLRLEANKGLKCELLSLKVVSLVWLNNHNQLRNEAILFKAARSCPRFVLGFQD